MGNTGSVLVDMSLTGKISQVGTGCEVVVEVRAQLGCTCLIFRVRFYVGVVGN